MLNYKLIITILFSIFAINISAQNKVSDLKKKKEKALRDIRYTSNLLKKTKANKNKTITELKLINNKIRNRQRLIDVLEQEKNLYTENIYNLNSQINTLEKKIKTLKSQYEKAILYSWKQRGDENKLLYILSAESFNQAFKRYEYLKDYRYYLHKYSDEIQHSSDSLKFKRERLNLLLREKQIVIDGKSKERETLEREKGSKNRLVKNLKYKEKRLQKNLKAKQKYSKNLNRQIIYLINREKQARLAEKNKKKRAQQKKINTKISTDFKLYRGKLNWPTKGFISEKYGTHFHPVLKHVKVRNDGIDITSSASSVCKSVFSGKVTHVLSIPGVNNVVIVQHGNYYTVYSNLSVVSVKKGQKLNAGDKIGTIHKNSNENFSILNFQIWKESTKLNPELWLKPHSS
ncbi:MAG: peptidoglycan DD-metalloendopeptidase family protein [Marinifilaceae bacterium]|jgi:septal ring factor EnvC (AmiA/AmiB activator)|nr:peptidoglycan DD-metalloendopeptidase family protein [Marinifilaceae bacterium]